MGKNGAELSNRKRQILKAVIESYIENGEPVGSKTLTQQGQIPFSSATIRNEMADLESMGYLEQPHTSSGRVPTELGYRFYVDTLVENYDLTNREILELKEALRTRQTEIDSILDSAMKLASSMTNYPALAVRPHSDSRTVSRYEVVFITARALLLVMVMPDGTAKTRNLPLERDVTSEGAAALADAMNRFLTGITAQGITLPRMMEMETALGEWGFLTNPAVKKVYEVLHVEGSGDIRVEGVNRLLSYPEYSDLGTLKNMLTMFEEKRDLLDVFTAEEDSEDVHILIGRENPVDTMENSTLIFKPVKRDGRTVGAIGIIGPTRMDYSKVIAMINQLSDSVSEMMDRAVPQLQKPAAPALGDGGKTVQ